MFITVWKLNNGKDSWFYTNARDAVNSVKLSYSKFNPKVTETEKSILVRWYEENALVEEYFSLEKIVDNIVLDRVEHL
jgi:hypothetical protein